MSTATATSVMLDRKNLMKALEQLSRIIPARCTKPILQCVRIEASDYKCVLTGTDLEMSLSVEIPADGQLPTTIVLCRDLLQRIKTGKDLVCQIVLDGETLIVNGGVVHHRLRTDDPKEYPPLSLKPEGKVVRINNGELRDALKVALTGVARESTRYAINGIHLEVGKGVQVVATDGRRLVTIELKKFEARDEFKAILPVRFCQMLIRLLGDRDDDAIDLHLKENANDKGEKTPSDVTAVGARWMLGGLEVDGHFPAWREIIPRDGSRFLLDRLELLGLVREVSTAAGETNKGVHLRLAEKQVTVSCRSESGGESSGQGCCRSMGGGDSLILTGFNPDFLEDVLETLSGSRVLIQLRQNTPAGVDAVAHHAAVFSNWADPAVRWVVMAVNTGVAPSTESLGSNFREKKAA